MLELLWLPLEKGQLVGTSPLLNTADGRSIHFFVKEAIFCNFKKLKRRGGTVSHSPTHQGQQNDGTISSVSPALQLKPEQWRFKSGFRFSS